MISMPMYSTAAAGLSLRLRTGSVAPTASVHGSGLSFAAAAGENDAKGLPPRGAPV